VAVNRVWSATETTLVSVRFPSVVVAVIVADPAPTAVTTPAAETLATFELLVVQVTVDTVASLGATEAERVEVPPAERLTVFGLTTTPVTDTVSAVTVTAQTSVKLPSEVVAVIVALPMATPETRPASVTVAIFVSLDDQETAAFVASEGATTAVNCTVFPITTPVVSGVTVTPVTEIDAADVATDEGCWHPAKTRAATANNATAFLIFLIIYPPSGFSFIL
jgi:hypothetical protein